MLKKTGRGVKGISLDKNDKVVFSAVVPPTQETFKYLDKELSCKKVRMRARAAKGQKATL